MTWIKQVDRQAKHVCARPEVFRLGGLWRCDEVGCRKLWRVGQACDTCDATGGQHYLGQCKVGLAWRPAHLSQRIRHWRQG